MSVDISRFFNIDRTTYAKKGIVVYEFKDELIYEFVTEYVLSFRRAYISDEELDEGVANEVWKNRNEGTAMFIPTLPNLKSGEFTEILLFYLSHCMRCKDANIAPMKWRWKEHKDMACHLTDTVMAKCEDENNPKEDDYLYFLESKAGATPIGDRSKRSVMNDGIEDAVKDCVSRAGKTVSYLVTKYTKEKKYDKARKMKRFDDSVEVAYKRYSNAAIVVEKDSLSYHIANITDENLKKARDHNISLFAVPVENMKAVYERMYNEVVNM